MDSHTPDPVTEGAAYRDALIALTAGEDPVAIQQATPGILRVLMDEAGPLLAARPEPREWSVLQCITHVVQAEMVYSARYRWTLAHDKPEMIGYDQDLWVDRVAGDDDPVQLMRTFEALRAGNLALWAATPEADRDRAGMHAERGPETYGMSFLLIAGHDRFHIAQARRALETLRT